MKRSLHSGVHRSTFAGPCGVNVPPRPAIQLGIASTLSYAHAESPEIGEIREHRTLGWLECS